MEKSIIRNHTILSAEHNFSIPINQFFSLYFFRKQKSYKYANNRKNNTQKNYVKTMAVMIFGTKSHKGKSNKIVYSNMCTYH